MKNRLTILLSVLAIIVLGVVGCWYWNTMTVPTEVQKTGTSTTMRDETKKDSVQPLKATSVIEEQKDVRSGEDTLNVTLLYCADEGGGCLPIGGGGLCEGTNDASGVNAYSANAIGVKASWSNNSKIKDVEAKGYTIYYTLTATDEYGETVTVIPRTPSSKASSAPFLKPLSIAFVGTLKPLLYHIIVDVEPNTTPGRSYQATAQLIVPTPKQLDTNPNYCNEVTNGSGSGVGV